IALGVEHLHKEGIVHGDLKGENIFVTDSGRACIADFGLSSIINSISSIQFTSSTRTRGTTRYHAPELHRGEDNDRRSDIYALACVAYELLTGNRLFPELRTDGAVAIAVLNDRRPPRSPSCSGTPSLDSLWSLLQNCWEEEPSMRPMAGQLVERLIGPDIQAKKTESIADWDETFMPRFRRYIAGSRSLPSLAEFEHIFFGDG
ncbi:kinase-like domain-containing protein, partial [Mycena rosella]